MTHEEESPVEYNPMIRDFPLHDRPRERLAKMGAQALSTTELIAIIFRTGTGGENVVRLAERLHTQMGGLMGIARASLTELQVVKGVGPAKAIEMKAALELGRRLLMTNTEVLPQIKMPHDAASLVMSDMAYLEQEHLRVLILNTRNRVMKISTVYIGSLNTSVVRIGELFRQAIRENAASIIVVHNHPSGDPTPSPEDIHVTKELVSAGKLLGIDVLDHLVIGRHDFVSLKERGLGFH